VRTCKSVAAAFTVSITPPAPESLNGIPTLPNAIRDPSGDHAGSHV